MRTDTLICTNQSRILARYFENVWPEVFDIMEVDKLHRISEIADQMECFAHYSPRVKRDYTKIILQELVRVTARQKTYDLLHYSKGKWVAPSKDSNWHRLAGVTPTDTAIQQTGA